MQQSLPPTSPNFLVARRRFVDSSDLRERLLKLQKLQTVFLEWKLAVEADKLLPDVNHLILSHITAKDQFRKSARYEELKQKLRALLVTLRQSILFSRGLQQLIVPNRGEYATVENDLPQ